MDTDRDLSLDLLKIIGTVLIYFHHYQQLNGTGYTLINYWGGKFYFGWLVELFFILSGMVAYRWLENGEIRKDFSSFFVDKAMRFIPMDTISVIVSSCMALLYFKRTSVWLFGHDQEWSLWGGYYNKLRNSGRMGY